MAKQGAVLNFRFRANSQNQTLVRESVNSFAKNFTNILVNQVAISARDKAFRVAKDKLVSSVRSAVNREIAQMSFMVSKFIVQPDGARGLSGTIKSFETQQSETARQQRWGYSTTHYDLSKSGVSWAERSFKYMLWKEKKGHSTDWWSLTGKLRATVGKAGFYTQNFGPVQVQFIKSDTLGAVKNVTATGPGRPVANLTVGTISVSVMGRITPDMIPALGSDNPGSNVTPAGKTRITSLIQDRETRGKLNTAPRGQYRPVLEPFLAYFLTRAIPNAVFRVTEKTVSDAGIEGAFDTARKNNDGGLNANFAR